MPGAGSMELMEFVLLANGAKGAAAINLIKRVVEAPGVYVFGEILDHPNIVALETSHPEGPAHLSLLRVFAYGTYTDYLAAGSGDLPPLTEQSLQKLRLLTVSSLATKNKIIKYSDLLNELRIDSIRELEDLIIEGANSNVLRGKLDQRSNHFEVDFAMGRDIRKADIANIKAALQAWCDSCDGMLACLEHQVNRANSCKQSHIAHKKQVEQKIKTIRGQLKVQQQLPDGPDDPDSRMESERERSDKKAGKAKGSRGSGKSGFWPK